MRVRVMLAVLALLGALARPASATGAAPDGGAHEAPGSAAQQLYEQAIVAEATGDRAGAVAGYQRLVDRHGDTLFACWARGKLAAIEAGTGLIDQDGRALFVVSSTAFGTWAGFAAAFAPTADADLDSRVLLWSAIGGAAAGLLPSLLLTRDVPVSQGRAGIVSFAWPWGLYHGLSAAAYVDDIRFRHVIGLGLAGSLVGYGAAVAATAVGDLAAGDSALLSSAAIWSALAVFGLGVTVAGEHYFDDARVAVSLPLLGGDAALLALTLLRDQVDYSVGRVGLISLGGGLGLLVAVTILTLSSPDNVHVGAGVMTAGTLAGLAAGWFATRGYDEPGAPGADAQAAALPALLSYDPAGGWRPGAPLPSLLPLPAELGTDGYQVSLPLAAGRW